VNVFPGVIAAAVAVACSAGLARAGVIETPQMLPALTPRSEPAPTQGQSEPDLLLWRKLGTVLDAADSALAPHAALSGQAGPDAVFDLDLFGTGPARPSAP
jgi:hypothetical protein